MRGQLETPNIQCHKSWVGQKSFFCYDAEPQSVGYGFAYGLSAANFNRAADPNPCIAHSRFKHLAGLRALFTQYKFLAVKRLQINRAVSRERMIFLCKYH